MQQHPDFGATTEDILLANQDIAEVVVNIHYKEGEAAGIIATRADNLYSGVETRINSIILTQYQWYGTTRNP